MSRLTDAERLRLLEEKKRTLEAQAASIRAKQRARERKEDTRRKIIVGGAVMAWLREEPERSQWLHDLLKARITRQQDQAVLTPLFRETPQDQPGG